MPLPLAVVDAFRCPACHANLDGLDQGAAPRCPGCGFEVRTEDGVIDLVPEALRGEERAFYDDTYDRALVDRLPATPASLAETWTGRSAPWEMQVVWKQLGDLRDRTVLLLGNGESYNELFMLTQRPRALIYSDLSPVGLRRLRDQLTADPETLVLAAIDAMAIPLQDESVDLVYGFAFAHHLPDVQRFLAEVARVLRPGGRCVFMDNGYSPLWQHVKLVWLRPVMWLSHHRQPRSPEDVRDTTTGGFREAELAAMIRMVGGRPWFERVAFLYYLWHRVSVSLFPGLFRIVPRHDALGAAFIRADELLLRFDWVRKNTIRLIWGFDKPPAPRRTTA